MCEISQLTCEPPTRAKQDFENEAWKSGMFASKLTLSIRPMGFFWDEIAFLPSEGEEYSLQQRRKNLFDVETMIQRHAEWVYSHSTRVDLKWQ